MLKRQDKVIASLFILPSVVGTTLLTAVPFLNVIYNSFYSTAVGSISWENYKMVFTNPAFKLALKNSYLFSFISVTVLYLISITMSTVLVFYTKGKFIKNVKRILAIPTVLPISTIALYEIVLFDKFGIINGILHVKQLSNVDWLEAKPIFVILVISFIGKNLGMAVILWGAGITNISESIIEASQLDGANKKQCFFYIILPNLKKTKYLVLLYFLIQSFKGFREIYLISGDYPYEGVYFLQNIFNNWFRDMELGFLAAGSVINIVILLIIIYLLQKKFCK